MVDNEPKVVVIGGGTGISNFLKGLKRYPVDITAIITVADDGGSSKQFREEMKMPPPGDVRKVILSLSEVEPILARLFKHRFAEQSGFMGHPIGNILLAAMQEITGDFAQSIKYLSKIFNVKGTVLPTSNEPLILCADLENGETIEGESNIFIKGSKIKKIYFKNEKVIANKEAVKAILDADLVVIGPGSLYTSIISSIIVPEIKEAIVKTKASKVYISNIMTQPSETMNYTLLDHIKSIENHIGEQCLDIIIANDQHRVHKEIYEIYKNDKAEIIKFDIEDFKNINKKIYTNRLISYTKNNKIRHDSKKLAAHVFAILLDAIEDYEDQIFI